MYDDETEREYSSRIMRGILQGLIIQLMQTETMMMKVQNCEEAKLSRCSDEPNCLAEQGWRTATD